MITDSHRLQWIMQNCEIWVLSSSGEKINQINFEDEIDSWMDKIPLTAQG